jgi:hypothetical protein
MRDRLPPLLQWEPVTTKFNLHNVHNRELQCDRNPWLIDANHLRVLHRTWVDHGRSLQVSVLALQAQASRPLKRLLCGTRLLVFFNQARSRFTTSESPFQPVG